MNYKLQLASFLFSLVYGIFFFITNRLNKKLIQKEKVIFKYIITFLYILNIVLIYIISIYKINTGIFHFYFILMVILGYIIGYLQFYKSKKYVKLIKDTIKQKKKMI